VDQVLSDSFVDERGQPDLLPFSLFATFTRAGLVEAVPSLFWVFSVGFFCRGAILREDSDFFFFFFPSLSLY